MDVPIDNDGELLGWKGEYIRSCFPKKPGSNARRQTLIFFPQHWKIGEVHVTVPSFNGTLYDDESGRFVTQDTLPINHPDILLIDSIPKNYIISKTGKHEVSEKQVIGICKEITVKTINYFDILITNGLVNENTITSIKEVTKYFTNSTYKSLMQKLIRYAAVECRIENLKLDALEVLYIVFTLLLTSKAVFVPDIKRSVSGQESALKRLLVSIIEDSYYPNDKDLLKLAVLSLMAQRVQGWKISEKDYLFVISLCKSALLERRLFKHNIEKGNELDRYVVSSENTNLGNVSALLDSIKSFTSDEGMVRFIAFNEGNVDIISEGGKLKRPDVMEIYHCIDQHTVPEIAYLLPIDIITKYGISDSMPFSKLFKHIFSYVTGVNSRKEFTGLKRNITEKDLDFIEKVRIAQKIIFDIKYLRIEKAIYTKTKKIRKVKWTIDDSWIAGLVGPINIPGKPPVMVTLKPDDPYQLVAIKRPSRGMKDGMLDDEIKELSIAKAKEMLISKGARLSAASPPVDWLSSYTLKLTRENQEEKYVFIKGKEIKEWADLKYINDEIPVLNLQKMRLGDIYYFSKGNGIVDGADDMLKEFVSAYPVSGAIRRTLYYISSNRGTVEVARLSKDGSGMYQAAIIEDAYACQILNYITVLYPKAISKVPGEVNKFKVTYLPLLEHIKGVLREQLISADSNSETVFELANDMSGRTLRDYQEESITEMTNKRKAGKKGHFIWIPPGMGKTMIVLEYIKRFIDLGTSTKYIIYTLPSSAIKSIFVELEYFGFYINYMRPIKGWKKEPFVDRYTVSNDTLLEGYINVIEHDDLKRSYDEILIKAKDSIFIIDEVHKALNDTKRTEVALSISRLAEDFIAMTGTPVVDTNTYKLIWWLEQIVDFEVNEKNFWVAANGMIAKKVNTGVIVNRKEVLASFTTKEKELYKSLVPKNLGGINSKPSNKDIRDAFEVCYQACDRSMVTETMKNLEDGLPVMMVARSVDHQKRLKNELIKKGLIDEDIFLLGIDGTGSIFLTDESVELGTTPDYKVVITTIRKSEGYTLTRMKSFITSVYPSNNATREQLENRINRITQRAKEIFYSTVHVGILTHVLQHHKDAASISAVLSSIAKVAIE